MKKISDPTHKMSLMMRNWTRNRVAHDIWILVTAQTRVPITRQQNEIFFKTKAMMTNRLYNFNEIIFKVSVEGILE